MQITETRIKLLENDGKIRALASVTFDGCFAVHDIKIIDGSKGLFMAMPSRKVGDDTFRDIAHPTQQFMRDVLRETVMDAYDRALREQMNMSDEEAGRIAAKFF